jgi:dihydrofolate synthase/folylpolyglutamate synthase
MDTFERYLDAERRLNQGLIRLDRSLALEHGYGPSPERRLDAMRDLLASLGNPHRGVPAVHVVGTSGKGSVAASVAGILAATGLRVGLHVSPYLQAMTEKIWIDGRFVSGAELVALADAVVPAARRFLEDDAPASVHGMAATAMAFLAFRRAGVEAAVIEAGCGARYDLTALADARVAVVTNVGADHLDVLGPGIEQVAWHKAGAARRDRPLVVGATGIALEVVRREAESAGARVVELPPEGDALAHNAALAARTAAVFGAEVGVAIGGAAFSAGSTGVRLACRSEVVQEAPRVILDGAHNADKIAVAVAAALARATPGPRVAVVGLLASKACAEALRPLAGRFDAIWVTEPRVFGKRALSAADARALLGSIGIAATAVADPVAALDAAIARAGDDGTVVVLGSFYLVGELRERWYAKRDVVLERTSWPAGNAADQPPLDLEKKSRSVSTSRGSS